MRLRGFILAIGLSGLAAVSVPQTHVLARNVSASPNVVVGPTLKLSSAQSTFPQIAPRVFCMARIQNAKPSAKLLFTFTASYLKKGNLSQVAGTVGGFPTSLKFAWLNGPFKKGTYGCSVKLDGKPFGATSYTVK